MASPAMAEAGGNGKSQDNANENAGANEHAVNNPHADEPEAPASSSDSGAAAATASTDSASTSSDSSASSASTASTASTASAASTSGSSSKATRGCNQTPYGSGGNGANTGGPYDDTCGPNPSLNGNGGGKATGKPCAGCVGNADEKNPKGQMPGGNDHNNGYECDGNKGVGKTNPAHTGCKTNPPDNPPPPPNDQCVPSATVTCSAVLDRTLTRTTGSSAPGTEVLGAVFTRGAPGALAFTGSSVFGPAALGTIFVLLGSALLVASKRRRPVAVR